MRHAVILAGGSGTRLWPASRRARPKQFSSIDGTRSLLEATVARLRAVAAQVTIVTAAEHAGLCREAVPSATILAEPVGRNTAAALGLAALVLEHRDPGAVMGAFPADQHVTDEVGFGATVERAYAAAHHDVIGTIGLTPTHAEIGFGYLELGGDRPDLGDRVRDVVRFVEKPDLATAAELVASGRHLWNGGMFFVRAARLLAEIERQLPALREGLREIEAALPVGEAATAAAIAAVYPRLPSISIDHGVMEHATGVVAVPGAFGWSDVGSWQAVAALLAHDARANAARGDAVVIDGTGNLTYTDQGAIALVGVSGLAVVRAGNAVLVIPVVRAQDVRAAVAGLAERGLDEYL